MSRTKPTDLEAVTILTPCSYCGAFPGSWCVVVRHFDGTPYDDADLAPWAAWLHEARSRPIRETWWKAHEEGERNLATLALERADRAIKAGLEGYPGRSTTFPLFAEWLRTQLATWLK